MPSMVYLQATLSGLMLGTQCSISLYTYNEDDYFPLPPDPFSPFRAFTSLHSLSLPIIPRPLCSFGKAFQDDASDIREIWVGVSDGYNSTANVEPFRLMRRYCLPCLMGCSNICSQG